MPLDADARAPREIWNDYFAKRRPDPEVVRNLVLRLHEEDRHAHVIAAIEAALVHGQSQPWMYDVLAVSMKLDDRPAEDVERALFSRLDFTVADVPSMIYSAAYLRRFEADDAALRMYRQASVLDPTSPHPYVLGLTIAREKKDHDAVRWAVAGILTSVWTKDRDRLHREAQDAAAESRKELLAAGRAAEAEALDRAVREALQRDLVLRLTWSGSGDLDLSVEEPPGTVCSFLEPRTRGGGAYLHDGFGPEQANCYEHYVCARAVSGSYRVRIDYKGGEIVGQRAQLEVVRHQGSERESVRKLTVPLDRPDKIVRLTLKDGRRTEFATEAETRRVFEPLAGRRPLAQMLGGTDAAGRAAERRFRQSRPASTAGAVGYTPIVTLLNQGSTMSAMAVVSGDRRYVRLSVAPLFNQITDVFTFTAVGGLGGVPGGGGGGGGGAGGGTVP
ncbi:MAG: hypothetical protein WD069_19250 [Planctomycetales bacterium]